MGIHYSHLSWNDRLTIDRMLREGFKVADISKAIGFCRATIYNEIKRSRYIHTNSDLTEEERYNPEGAQERYEFLLSKKGSAPKAADNDKWLACIGELILEKKYSPAAALYEIERRKIDCGVKINSVGTIYSYIRKGYFCGLSMEDLPLKKKKGRKKKKVKRQKNPSKGTSIEKRPEHIQDRKEFGHWEMDTVIGKAENKKNLLVITERKTRKEIIEVLKNHTAVEVKRALNRIEKRIGSNFYKLFKTITVDNGSEFLDHEGMEKALYRVGKRTSVYFCHPYRSCERGTNENQNKLVRRWYPKGTDFDKKLNRREVKDVEQWINDYPRKLFGGKTANDMFFLECDKSGIVLKQSANY